MDTDYPHENQNPANTNLDESSGPENLVDEQCAVIEKLPADRFQHLVNKLSAVLEPSTGLSFHDVDPRVIINAMENYQSGPVEWQKFALGDNSRAYTRNLVHRGNGKSNLLILVWSPGRKSPIHDHADSHCVMKVLQGRLVETRFKHTFPSSESISIFHESIASNSLEVTRKKTFGTNDVAYMCDELGLHHIANPDPHFPAVSLHLYTPPNAEKLGCHIFNESTGRKTKTGGCGFYSVKGMRC